MTTPVFEPRSATFAARVKASFDAQPYMGTMGGRLVRVEPGRVEIALPCRKDLAQQQGTLHGGAILGLADTAAGYAAMSLLADGEDVMTVDCSMSFLRAVRSAEVVAVGRVVKPGRTLLFCQTEVFAAEAGRPVGEALAAGPFTIIRVPASEPA